MHDVDFELYARMLLPLIWQEREEKNCRVILRQVAFCATRWLENVLLRGLHELAGHSSSNHFERSTKPRACTCAMDLRASLGGRYTDVGN